MQSKHTQLCRCIVCLFFVMLLFYLLLAKNPPSVPPRCAASFQRCQQALLTSTSCDWLPVQFSAALTLFSSCPTRAHTFTSLQADLLFMHVWIVPNGKQKHTNSFFRNFYSPITWCIFRSILCQETKANVQHWLFKSHQRLHSLFFNQWEPQKVNTARLPPSSTTPAELSAVS